MKNISLNVFSSVFICLFTKRQSTACRLYFQNTIAFSTPFFFKKNSLKNLFSVVCSLNQTNSENVTLIYGNRRVIVSPPDDFGCGLIKQQTGANLYEAI